nr:hypothetical protein GCM10020093_088200 [Planobispora longispora]
MGEVVGERVDDDGAAVLVGELAHPERVGDDGGRGGAVLAGEQRGQVPECSPWEPLPRLKWPPAEKNGVTFPVAGSTAFGSHLPVAWMWKPWKPGVRPFTVTVSRALPYPSRMTVSRPTALPSASRMVAAAE